MEKVQPAFFAEQSRLDTIIRQFCIYLENIGIFLSIFKT